MLRPSPPRGETGRMAEMKNHRRWVTWMAALLIAAAMVSLPRAGTALPIRDPMPSGFPWEFGDPDEPHGARPAWWDLMWLRNFRLQAHDAEWAKPDAAATTYRKQSAAPLINRKPGEHE